MHAHHSCYILLRTHTHIKYTHTHTHIKYTHMQLTRNKIGMLEMRTEGTFKKIKWKPCNVKVTSTYLLHFRDLDNVSLLAMLR